MLLVKPSKNNRKSFLVGNIRQIAGILPLVLLPAALSAATTYYANPTGSDSNPGTYSQPFRTVSRGITAASAGDTIVLQDGTYPADTPYGGGSTSGWLLWISKSGTASAPITLKAEHKQKAILDCGNSYNQGQTGCMGYIYLGNPGPAYWVFQDLVITRTYDIAFLMNSTTPAHDITVKGCRFEQIGQHVTSQTTGMDGVYANEGHYNLVFDGNVFDGIGRLSGSTYMFNDHALYLHSSNTLVKNNVFYGSISGWGVQTAVGFSGSIMNNTFAFTAPNTGGQVMLWDVASGAITVQNNVFYQPPSGFAVNTCGLSAPSCVLDHNLVYGGSIGGAATCGGSVVCTSSNTSSGNPMFVNASSNDYHIQSTSAALDAGVTLSSSVPTDYDGTARPQGAGYDQGAYEFATASTPTISNVSASNLTSNSATITWTTNVSTNSAVEYGPGSYSSTTPTNTTMVTQHSMGLSNLSSGTTYHYAALSSDSAGNLATSPDFTFSTGTVPFGFNISAPSSSSVTQGSTTTGTVSTSLTSGSGQTVSFSATGLPSGVSASFSPASCTVPCSSTVTFNASGTATTGTANVTIKGAASSTSATANDSLTVAASSTGTVGSGGTGTGISGLAAEWMFNEGAGSYTADASGNGNTGTLLGRASWARGPYGTAISFNGNTSFVSVPERASLELSTAMTVSFWINAANVPGVDQRIVSKNYDWDVKLNGSSHYPQFSSGGTYAEMNYALPMGTWVHVAFTLNNGTVTGYINGVARSFLGNTFASGFTLPNWGYGLNIGADSSQSNFAKGLIDDVRVYNRALSGSEVSTIYSQTKH